MTISHINRIATIVFASMCSIGVAQRSSAEPLFAVTSTNLLFAFDSATPGTMTMAVGLSGLQSGESLLGIDFRPATGALYGLGSTSRLYTINTATGAATQIGTAGAFTLNGTSFGFDFNPMVDRIRVTSDADQNLRLNPNDGTLTATDAALNPGNPSIVGSGYTNNFPGTATTTLFDIDSATDALYVQNPPNAGTLSLVGPLGLDAREIVGFDISGVSGIAYAALQTAFGGASQLFTINLTTGAATLLGQIGTGHLVTGIAAPIGAAVPEPATFMLLGGALAFLARRQRR